LALADPQPLVDKLLVLTKLALTTMLGVAASTDTVCDMVGERERVGDTVEEAEDPTEAVKLEEVDAEMLPVTLTEGVGEREAEELKVDDTEEDTLPE